jgi:hypothetical protein
MADSHNRCRAEYSRCREWSTPMCTRGFRNSGETEPCLLSQFVSAPLAHYSPELILLIIRGILPII